MESQVKFQGPQNISAASQQNNIAATSKVDWRSLWHEELTEFCDFVSCN